MRLSWAAVLQKFVAAAALPGASGGFAVLIFARIFGRYRIEVQRLKWYTESKKTN